MNFTSIINKFLNKKEFYILLISVALAWIANLYHIGEFPIFLSILCLFLVISFLLYAWRNLIRLANSIKINRRNRKKIIRQNQTLNELVQTAFAGMSTIHKMEALKVITELPSLPNNKYRFLVTETHKYSLVRCDNYINNPFHINLMNMEYIPLVEVNHQPDYCVVTFNSLFYQLLVEHSSEIKNDIRQQYPDKVKYFLGD